MIDKGGTGMGPPASSTTSGVVLDEITTAVHELGDDTPA
jgi:hypothetical protein